MSWVSEIWSTAPITVDGRLPTLDGHGWQRDGPQHASYLGPEWLLTIEPLREEDWLWGEVPLAVRRVLPQARTCLLVGLEGGGRSKAARKAAFQALAQTVAALMLGQAAVCWDQDELAVTRAQLLDREGIKDI
jgi:hypothetical protein